MRKKIKELLDEVDGNTDLPQDIWEIWSGQFNRDLRVLIGDQNDADKYKFVFTYWSTINKTMQMQDGDELENLKEQARLLRAEALR